MDIRHENQHGKGRFSTPGGESELTYTMAGDTTAIFEHTYVPASERGQGIAAILTRAALDEARRLDWKIIPACSYVETFIKRNPDFTGLLAG